MCKLTLFRFLPAGSCRKKLAEQDLQLLWVLHLLANLLFAMCPPTPFAPVAVAISPVFAQVLLRLHLRHQIVVERQLHLVARVDRVAPRPLLARRRVAAKAVAQHGHREVAARHRHVRRA